MSANKERITLNFRKNSAVSMENIKIVLDKINDKELGRDIDMHDIITDFIKNHTEKDIKRIQYTSMSIVERARYKFEKEVAKTGEKISFDDYMAKKLGV